MKKPIIAICYDFDGTLIRGNMQEASFIPDIGETKKEFWDQVNKHAKDNDMDSILSYMKLMIEKSKENNLNITKQTLKDHGKDLPFFPGVEQWFDLINDYSKSKPIKLEHFIISSGVDETIKESKVGQHFKHVFASGFCYDKKNKPIFAARSINYTTKVQYLFRINKGIYNSWDDEKINKVTSIEDRRIPFPHMIYIGDGQTDVPTMKMLNYQGGYTIAVFPPKDPTKDVKEQDDKKKNAEKLVQNNRAHFAIKADYSKNKELYKVITMLIDRISGEVDRKMNLNASNWAIVNPQGKKKSPAKK